VANLEQVIVGERKCVIGSVEYLVKPPTLSDWTYFINWNKDQKKKDLIETYKLAGEKIDIKAISEVMVGLEDAISSALQIEGLVILVHRLIEQVRTNPKITIDELKEQITLKDINMLSDLIVSSLPMGDDSKNLEKPQ
jgi:hypothetical protein